MLVLDKKRGPAPVRMREIVPTGVEDDKKQIVTDDEGNVRYFFRVTGRLHETVGEQADIEKALTAWLTTQLPTVMNVDHQPIVPKLMFDVKESPVFALQQRVVQRGLDGAVFTEALFDEKGHLEISGRTHQLDDAGDKAIDAAVKDVLGNDLIANLQTMNPHRSVQKNQPIAWQDAVRLCQARLCSRESAQPTHPCRSALFRLRRIPVASGGRRGVSLRRRRGESRSGAAQSRR